MNSGLSVNLQKAIDIISGAAQLDTLLSAASFYFKSTSSFCHASFWGNDKDQKRLFLVREFVDVLGIKDFPKLNTLSYEDNVLGRIANENIDNTIIEAVNFDTLISNEQVRVYLNNHKVNSIALIHFDSLPDYDCYLVILIQNSSTYHFDKYKDEIKIYFNHFLHKYSILRYKAFEDQVRKILKLKVTKSRYSFLEEACSGLYTVFSASSISLWVIEDGKVKSKFFSDNHSGGEYNLDQGLTGAVAQSGEPMFLHLLSDAETLYNRKWVGLISDFSQRPPDPSDHIMILPLKYPSSVEDKTLIKGVIRFVSAKENPSFWPVDFKRARVLTKIMSTIFHQELLMQNLEVRKQLLDYLFRARAGLPLEETKIELLALMLHWEGIENADIFEVSKEGQLNFSEINFIDSEQISLIKSTLSDSFHEKKDIDDALSIYPISSSNQLFAILIAKFQPSLRDISSEWVQMVGLFLSTYYSINELLIEAKTLRKRSEEKELNALSGMVARQLSHEVVNACKAINSWVSIYENKAPNYNELRKRVTELNNNVDKIIKASGHNIIIKECDFIEEVSETLKTIGVRHEGKKNKCTTLLRIHGFKHRHVNMDPSTLIGIINNLVLNATEQYELAKKAGPIEISIVEKTIGDEKYIGISVKDYARGIPDNDKSMIYNDGFTTKPGGKGIGLSIVRHLAEICGGHIDLLTTYGHYADFVVYYRCV